MRFEKPGCFSFKSLFARSPLSPPNINKPPVLLSNQAGLGAAATDSGNSAISCQPVSILKTNASRRYFLFPSCKLTPDATSRSPSISPATANIRPSPGISGQTSQPFCVLSKSIRQQILSAVFESANSIPPSIYQYCPTCTLAQFAIVCGKSGTSSARKRSLFSTILYTLDKCPTSLLPPATYIAFRSEATAPSPIGSGNVPASIHFPFFSLSIKTLSVQIF